MAFDEPEWMDPIGPLDVDVDRDGDHWAEHLIRALQSSVGWKSVEQKGSDRRAGGPYILKIIVTSDALQSQLWLSKTPEGVEAIVVGEGQATDAQVAPWRDAVRAATELLNVDAIKFPWHAAVGVDALATHEGLAADTTVGPLQLSPGQVCFKKSGPSVPPMFFHPGGVFPSWPIVVKGTARTVRWELASTIAARELHRLCGLLTLACDEPWVVRQSPLQRGAAPLMIPRFGAGDTTAQNFPGEFSSAPIANLMATSWVPSSWNTLESDPTLDNAVAMFHQGANLRRRHPSFATVAFVGAIEAVGNGLPANPPGACDKCGNVPGAAAGFRQALELVMTVGEAKKYCKAVYGRRSHTAHRGALFGPESLAGSYEESGVLTKRPLLVFSWSELWPLQEVARKVIVAAITRAADSSMT